MAGPRPTGACVGAETSAREPRAGSAPAPLLRVVPQHRLDYGAQQLGRQAVRSAAGDGRRQAGRRLRGHSPPSHVDGTAASCGRRAGAGRGLVGLRGGRGVRRVSGSHAGVSRYAVHVVRSCLRTPAPHTVVGADRGTWRRRRRRRAAAGTRGRSSQLHGCWGAPAAPGQRLTWNERPAPPPLPLPPPPLPHRPRRGTGAAGRGPKICAAMLALVYTGPRCRRRARRGGVGPGAVLLGAALLLAAYSACGALLDSSSVPARSQHSRKL